MARIDQAVDDGLGDDGILEELDPTPWIDLAGDDDGSLPVTLLQDVDKACGLFVGIISESEVVQDQDLGAIEVSYEDKIAAGDFLRLDFLHQQIDGGESDADLVLAESASDRLSQVRLALPGFSQDDEVLSGMVEGAMGQFTQFGFGNAAVEG